MKLITEMTQYEITQVVIQTKHNFNAGRCSKPEAISIIAPYIEELNKRLKADAVLMDCKFTPYNIKSFIN